MNISVPKLDGRAHSTFRKHPKHLNSGRKNLVSAVMIYKEGINAFYTGLSCKKPSSFVCLIVVCAPWDAALGFPPATGTELEPFREQLDIGPISRRFRPGGQGWVRVFCTRRIFKGKHKTI